MNLQIPIITDETGQAIAAAISQTDVAQARIAEINAAAQEIYDDLDENYPNYSQVLAELQNKTEKVQIDYEGGNVFKLHDQTLNFADIYRLHIQSPDFAFIQYGNRAYLCSYVNVPDTGMKEMRFESVINSDLRTKVSSIYIISNDGISIVNTTVSDINSENSSNKVSAITEALKTSENHYPSTKAVADYVSPLNEDLDGLRHKSANLHDVSKVTDGAGIKQDGTIPSAQTSLCYSAYIPVHANEPVTISNSEAAYAYYALYDTLKNPVGRRVDLDLTQTQSGYTVTPTVNGYIVVSTLTTKKVTTQVEYGNSKTDFEPYGKLDLAESVHLDKNDDYKSLSAYADYNTRHQMRIAKGILPTAYAAAIGTIVNDPDADINKDYYVNNPAHAKYGTMMFFDGTTWVYDEVNKSPGLMAIGTSLLKQSAKYIAAHNQNRRLVSFAVITDTHANAYPASNNIALFRSFLNLRYVDFGIHCGDIISSYGSSRNQYVEQFTQHIGEYDGIEAPMYFAKGNHDGNINSTSTQQDIDTNAVSKYQYSMLVQNRCGSRVIDSANPHGGYYYFDFKSEKVRIVILNDFEQPKINDEIYHSAYQIAWLYNTALRFSEDGWSVVLISHYITSRTKDTGVILEAFSHPGTPYTDPDSGATYTFPTEHAGVLAAHVFGHTHIDVYYDNTAWNRIGVQRGYAEQGEVGTPSEFCFSVFTIDPVGNKIYETRIGRGSSREYSIVPAAKME